MTDEAKAREAFMTAVDRIYKGVDPKDVRVVTDGDVAVPGFLALEVVAEPPLRGWANEEVGVLARRQNFAPILDALHFLDDARSPTAAALAHQLAWLHGPPYTLEHKLAEGELDAPEAMDLTPRRERRDDGAVVLTFALRDPGGDGEPECVFQYTIIGHGEDSYRIGTAQLAPPVD